MPSTETEEHLQAACRWLDALLRRHLLRLRSEREHLPDQFRGLCITESQMDDMLADGPEPASRSAAEAEIAALRREETRIAERYRASALNQLCTRFGLSDFERRVLLIALAPELELRFQTLYAYIQNDVTRKLPSIDLMLTLLCVSRECQWNQRAVFSATSPLFRNLLLRIPDESASRESPQLASSIAIPPRITEFLLGHVSLDPALAAFATLLLPSTGPGALDLPSEVTDRLWRVAPHLGQGGVVMLSARDGMGKAQAAKAICRDLRLPLIICDLRGDEAIDRLPGALLRRECILLNSALYLKLGSHTVERCRLHADLSRHLSFQQFPIFISLEEGMPPRPAVQSDRCFRFSFELPDARTRRALWLREIGKQSIRVDSVPEIDVLAGEFRFTPGQIRAVAREARAASRVRGRDGGIAAEDIREAARNVCSSHLQALAQRVELLFDWNDLVLPTRVLQQLREIATAVRLRHVVHGQWRFDAKVGKEPGINILFCGVSGTGKTMAAGVLARNLGLELYKVDLSTIVSKYVGETEQNLRRIFDEAEHSNAVLFFDEADALFGKRSEVKDAQDRYANLEVAYLLQKMEQFSGLAVLATNLNRNIDSAFVRRMQHVVEFPFPDAVHRERIWRGMFPAAAPVGGDVDFSFLSRQFELTGGNIRNAATAGAFLAAECGQPISMEHLVQGVGREMQKLGKLPSRAEFQAHFGVISKLNGDRQ